VLITALLLTLLACNRDPCQAYVAAFNDCYEVHDPDSAARLESNYCADFDDSSDDYFACLAESYERGDCTSDTGLAQIDAEVAECTL
jgi:hypothetical protein